MAVALSGVLLMLGLIHQDLYLPVFDDVHTQPGLLIDTVQDLIIPVLHCGLQVLKRSYQSDQLIYLWLGEVCIVKRVQDINVQGCTVLAKSLESQGSFVAPVVRRPGHLVWQVSLGGNS